MVSRTQVLVACLLVTTGCARAPVVSDGGTEAEVLGVVVERTDDAEPPGRASDDAAPTEQAEEEVVPEPDDVGETPTAERSDPDGVAAEPPPDDDPAPQPGDASETGSSAATSPPPPPPSAPPTETPPEALAVPAGDGWSYVSWEASEGSWVEVSARPPITRGDPDGAAAWPLRVELVDTLPVAGPGATPAPVRNGVCQAWLQAPEDRSLAAVGRVEVSLIVDGGTALTSTHDVDLVLEPGERHDLEDLGELALSVEGISTVTCVVRLE